MDSTNTPNASVPVEAQQPVESFQEFLNNAEAPARTAAFEAEEAARRNPHLAQHAEALRYVPPAPDTTSVEQGRRTDLKRVARVAGITALAAGAVIGGGKILIDGIDGSLDTQDRIVDKFRSDNDPNYVSNQERARLDTPTTTTITIKK